MFSVKQETKHGEKLWPEASHVFTTQSGGPNGGYVVTAVFANGSLFDFRPSRNHHTVYVMNENGSTVARYVLGNNPSAVDLDAEKSPEPSPAP